MLPLWIRKILYYLLGLVLLGVISQFFRGGKIGLGDFNKTTLFLYLGTGPIILILDSLICIARGAAKSYFYIRSYSTEDANVSEYAVTREKGREAIRLSLIRLVYPAIVLIIVLLMFLVSDFAQ
jgi:hypothetical protein